MFDNKWLIRRAFLESPETFRTDFGHDNSHSFLKTKTFLSKKLCYTLNISYLSESHVKMTALKNEWFIYLQMAFWGRKLFGTFEKRTQAAKTMDLTTVSKQT